MQIAYLNNKFIPLHRAKVPILDRGFQYGDGVFETMRSYGGVVFRLEKHIARLFGSLGALHIYLKISKSEIEKTVYKLLKKNKLKNAYIKIIVTRGTNLRNLVGCGTSATYEVAEVKTPTLAIYALPYKPKPERVYRKGMSLYISEAGLNEKSRITGHKTLNYMNNLLCRNESRKKGFDEVVFVNANGHISEASTSNIFLVKNKKIYTPARESGILPGITRDEVICLAGKYLNNKVKEDFIRARALCEADEIFLTNSLAEIMPVAKIGKKVVGKGRMGPVTERLRELYKDAVKKYCNKGGEK